MDAGLRGQRALVVGGGSGIGAAVSRLLANEGADVALSARREHADLLADLRSRGVRAFGFAADAGDEAQVVRLVADSAAVLGGLDVLVYVAAARHNEPVPSLTRPAIDHTFEVSLIGCMVASREVARIFVAQRHGAVVVIGSTATMSAQPTEAAYRAAKAGLLAHMEVMAVEMAPHGVRVNMVTPGAVDTEFVADFPAAQRAGTTRQIPLRREASPDEIAPAVVFLLSDRLSPYTTGANIVVDGGLRLRPLGMTDPGS
jgi:NAD(P)-dependent dehydrogenase (short-subunit alcohol dehydrogenase family)